MPPLQGTGIKGYVAGDTLSVIRTVANIPTGRTMTKGYFTVKVKATDADPGVLQKTITTAPSASGQITDPGASGTGSLLFTLSGTDTGTTLGVGPIWAYDIEVIFDDASIATLEVGTVSFIQGVTSATS